MSQQLFTIQDDKIVINKLALRYLEGSVIHAGSFDIVGNASVQNNLTVAGTITVDTVKVKNLITDTGDSADVGKWITNRESELEGKGLSWTFGTGNILLAYRNGGRLWSNADFDLDKEKSYKIDNVSVISATELGPQITKSRLKEVGPLRSLTVTGNTLLSEFAYFNSNLNRFGINTDQPNATFSVVDNDVELIMGSPNYGFATIGTYSNHHLSIVTDNTPRLTFKNNGEIVFGSELVKSANVIINGTLKVDNLISDTRIDRYTPLEFKGSKDQSIYGLGIVWSDKDTSKQLILRSDVDRVWCSESFDIASDRAYMVNGTPVLSGSTLGSQITNSNIKKLGVLESLEVEGDSNLNGRLSTSIIKATSISLTDGIKFLNITNASINTNKNLSITVSEDEVYYADDREIAIGNKLNSLRPVKIYGSLSVGISNPDPTVGFSVKGPVSFNDKKFITGDSMPTAGSFTKGDICWNQNPTAGNYIGWVCITEGSPGTWLPFGLINS